MNIQKLNELGRLEMRRTQNLSKLDSNQIYRLKKFELVQTQHGPRIIAYIDDININKVYFPPRFGIYYSRVENEEELKKIQEETLKGETYFKYLGGPQQKIGFYTLEEVMEMRRAEQRAQLLSPPAQVRPFQFSQPISHPPTPPEDDVNPSEGKDVVDHHQQLPSQIQPIEDASHQPIVFQFPATVSEVMDANQEGITFSQIFQESQNLDDITFEDIVFEEEFNPQATSSNFEANIPYTKEKKENKIKIKSDIKLESHNVKKYKKK